MQTLSVNVPDAVLYDTRMSAEDSQSFAKRATALMYYTSKGVSLGYCAQIAEMQKADFIRFLSENGVSIFDLTSDELARDIENAQLHIPAF